MPVKNSPVSTSDREIVTTRVFDAPRELVWKAWTDQKHVEIWWGPKGFTNTFKKFEVKRGGKWVFIMHGPDGVDYPNRIVFEEVVKPERLVYAHSGDTDNDPAQFHTTVTFAEVKRKTQVTMRAVFPTAEQRDLVVTKYGAVEGAKQTLDRLEAHLKKM